MESHTQHFTLSPELLALDKELYQTLKANPKYYTYGTSGFRYHNTVMRPISLRVGLFMDLLARYAHPQAYGIVISASHNPAPDNGLKLINPEGEMLDWKFEKSMDEFINEEDLTVAMTKVSKSLADNHPGKTPAPQGTLVVARDTRSHGADLLDLIRRFGLSHYVDLGLMATPAVYFLVAHINHHRKGEDSVPSPAELTDIYIDTINKGFAYNMDRQFKRKRFNVVIDCANGVGSLMLEKFRAKNSQLFSRFSPTLIYNEDWDRLNENCGADWVHRKNQATEKFLELPQEEGIRTTCFVLDGDADRSVFYQLVEPGKPQILLADGNRICVLYARVIAHFRNLITQHRASYAAEIVEELLAAKVGVVYTAYSNNAYVTYVREVLGLSAEIARTGVKFVHEKASTFDIGIYFESNGHGCLIYKPRAPELLRRLAQSATTPEARHVAEDFLNYLVGQNNINGDAIGNVMLILSSFEILDCDVQDLFSCYTDNQTLLTKVPLRDRTLMKSTEDERILASPEEIQPELNALLAQHLGYIAFVRASGTEDCCRVYTEGKDPKVLATIEAAIRKMVTEHPKLK